MNISPLTIYLWQLADQVSIPLFILTLLSLLMGVICTVVWKVEKEEKCKWPGITGLMLFLFFMCLKTLIPSSNTIAMMVVIPQIAESKMVQKDLPELYNAAVEALKNNLKK